MRRKKEYKTIYINEAHGYHIGETLNEEAESGWTVNMCVMQKAHESTFLLEREHVQELLIFCNCKDEKSSPDLYGRPVCCKCNEFIECTCEHPKTKMVEGLNQCVNCNNIRNAL